MIRPGPYVCLDVGLFEDPLFAGLTPASRLLFVKFACYSSAELTDGHIPTALLPPLLAAAGATRRNLNDLLKSGLVEELPISDGYYLRGYLKWNPKREELERRREESRRRNAEWRERQAAASSLTNGRPS